MQTTHLNISWTALDSSAEHDASIFFLLQLNGGLPQSHRVRHVLQCCNTNTRDKSNYSTEAIMI